MTSLPKVDKLNEPLSLREVVDAIQQQQNGKTVGIDVVPEELVKYGGTELHRSIWKHFIQMWEEENVPDNFQVPRVCPLYKSKGNKSDYNSYRGISLLTFLENSLLAFYATARFPCPKTNCLKHNKNQRDE